MVDSQLIQKACEGDPAALEEVLRQCQPSVTRFARRYCALDDVEDVVQETLTTLYLKIGTLRMSQALASWLFQIVRHHCYRLLSRPGARTPPVSLDACDRDPADATQDSLAQDLKRDVVSALARLPAAYRQILILRDVEGYSTAEVAAQLALTPDTVKSRLQKGRHLMRQMLSHWTL